MNCQRKSDLSKPASRVLLIDDDEDDYFIIRRLFDKIPKSEFKLEWINNAEDAQAAIESDEHDIYLVDYRLDSSTGIELLGNFDLTTRRQPFIILTGAGDKQIEITAMKMGVADYLIKGKFDGDLLSRVLYYSLQRKQMEVQRVEELIKINNSKDEFISLASHQLRTPATAVKQYVGMILQGFAGDITEQQQTFMTHAYNSNERQLKIINDILRIARLDLKRISLSRDVFDIRDLIQEIIDDLKPDIQDKQQKIDFIQPSQDMEITADHTYLNMAISNIVDNASKYTPTGKKISVSVEQHDGMYRIIVKDQGVGIETENMDKLFVKFSRIANPLSIAANGTGLGLYWTNEIISLHSGTIKVDSVIEKGTTFTVELPQNALSK